MRNFDTKINKSWTGYQKLMRTANSQQKLISVGYIQEYECFAKLLSLADNFYLINFINITLVKQGKRTLNCVIASIKINIDCDRTMQEKQSGDYN